MNRLMWFSPDGDGGSGAGAAGAGAAGTGTAPDQKQGGEPGAGAHTGAPQPQPQAAQTFTQEQVDKIVGERAKRAAQSAIGELVKALGVEKVDDLKTLVE